MKKVLVILALSMFSCATGNSIKDGAKAGGKIALNCAKDTIIEAASQIVPAILAILKTPGKSWKEQADLFAAAYTKEVTICAARNALEQLTAPVQAEAVAVDPETMKTMVTARVRELELEAGYLQ